MEIADKWIRTVKSAREEARTLSLLIDGEVEVIGVEASTVIYKRGNKTFHLVVHDVTEFQP